MVVIGAAVLGVSCNAVAAEIQFAERWESASSGLHFPPAGWPILHGDAGVWSMGDAIYGMEGEDEDETCGPTPHTIEIVNTGGSQAVRLTSNESDCGDNLWIEFLGVEIEQLGFSIPIYADTFVSFEETGALTDPEKHGWGYGCIGPPCYDNISLQFSDNHSNYLAYVLQRFPEAEPQHETNYLEIFLNPAGKQVGGKRPIG